MIIPLAAIFAAIVFTLGFTKDDKWERRFYWLCSLLLALATIGLFFDGK